MATVTSICRHANGDGCLTATVTSIFLVKFTSSRTNNCYFYKYAVRQPLHKASLKRSEGMTAMRLKSGERVFGSFLASWKFGGFCFFKKFGEG